MKDYKGNYEAFGKDGYYVIPKDQYEQIKKILSDDTDGLSAKSVRAIKEKVHEIEAQTGRSFFEVVQSGMWIMLLCSRKDSRNTG